MNKKHEKSACCQAVIIKYGNKRRQCVGCRRTWSVWKKRRGRKKKRIDTNLAQAFLRREIASQIALAKQRRCSEALVQKTLQSSRDVFIRTTAWFAIPAGNLILIADGVVEMVERQWHTIYLVLVRPVSGRDAVILPPLILSGTETASGWQSTSPEIRKVLSGFVSQYLDYRSYLKYPDLHLPTTNNTAESLASMIADLKRRMRGFPTFRSFERWIVALLKYKKTIACNGFHQQN